MRQAVIADPMPLGACALGACAALGVGELLSDYEKSRSHALGAEHVEDVVGYFRLGPVVEAERDFHFDDPLEPRRAAMLRELLSLGSYCSPPRRRWPYFFCSIGAPQHLSAPVPPLVTITCEPHLAQM
jgi:hypothetical protein